ncbi:Maf family nucleotide pyrophosphatase [Bartonella sp. TP]|uniref:Maf family nucleotide pyrophosphatase n=1 Tax=Bartonella sp. TP TaxID=3057550 RepID=UPI0025B083AC|nr:Maf family nucleotide pyrophosphatase [Bartonella sp. TP]WJW79663.1 Maf family nucleotide pyrophosphatase [Bartonella sp. TP]
MALEKKIATLKLILASASPRRLALLRQIGVEPDYVYATDIDEMPKYKEHPRFLVKRLAQEKALQAYARMSKLEAYKHSIVLAADTTVSVGRIVLPKPNNNEDAIECLKLLSGRTHKVFTALCVINEKGKHSCKISETRVRFARLSEDIIEAYIASREWEDKAGGYAIQGLAAGFITRIVGSYSNVVGLPLASTVNLLQSYGYPIFQQWHQDELRS